MQEEFNPFPSGQVWSSVHGAIFCHSTKNQQHLARSGSQKAAFWLYSSKADVQWNGKRLADGRAGRVRQSIPLAALTMIWDEEQMCLLWDYVSDIWMMELGNLGRDETSLGRGRRISWGGRQYCGPTGRSENRRWGISRLHQAPEGAELIGPPSLPTKVLDHS